MLKKHKWIAVLVLVSNLTAQAQQQQALDEGGANGSGNGGGEDITFPAVRDEVSGWLHRHLSAGDLKEKLELTSDPQALVNAFDQAVRDVGNRIEFRDERIMISGQYRVCKNEDTPKRITCDSLAWSGLQAVQPFVLYGVVFHEYLGIAGIETNINDYSQYPISSKIIRYAWKKIGYELRDAVNPQIISSDELYEILEGRKDYVGPRWWGYVAFMVGAGTLSGGLIVIGTGFSITMGVLNGVIGFLGAGIHFINDGTMGNAKPDSLKKQLKHFHKLERKCKEHVKELNELNDEYQYYCGKPYLVDRGSKKIYTIELRRRLKESETPSVIIKP